MTVSELAARVTVQAAGVVLAGALITTGLGHPTIALGILAGGVLGVGSFRWLTRSATALTGTLGGEPVRAWWLIAAGLRFTVMFAAISVVVVSGWAHPIGLMAAFVVVPTLLIVHGLNTATQSH